MRTLTGSARVAGVVGWPVAHSLSPRLHNYWLERHAIDGAYVPLPIRPEHFERALRALPLIGLRGFNVTVPHKERAFALVDRRTSRAERVGAVNTVVVETDGTLSGDNTDGVGFLDNLQAALPEFAVTGPAVVLGAGGAARAVASALLDAGVPELRLVNRTRRRADDLATVLGGTVRVVDWEQRDRALADAALLVNTTSLGMAGQPPLDIDLSHLPHDAVVNDIVYTPLETPLLRAAFERGNRVVDGIGMLLHQAQPGFAAWFGVRPDIDGALRAFVLSGLPG